MRLKNKVVVITGGSSGIGLATAKRFAEEGAFVYIFARDQSKLDETTQLLGKRSSAVAGDVRKPEDLERLYKVIASDDRKIDIVVANVGAVDSVKLADVTTESFSHNVDVNTRGVLFTVQKALPLLNLGASVILTSTRPFGLCRFQGRTPVLRTDLDDGAEGPRHSGEYHHARTNRYAADRCPGQFAGGSDRRAR